MKPAPGYCSPYPALAEITIERESLPVEILVSALQDTVHKSERGRIAKSKKVRTK